MNIGLLKINVRPSVKGKFACQITFLASIPTRRKNCANGRLFRPPSKFMQRPDFDLFWRRVQELPAGTITFFLSITVLLIAFPGFTISLLLYAFLIFKNQKAELVNEHHELE